MGGNDGREGLIRISKSCERNGNGGQGGLLGLGDRLPLATPKPLILLLPDSPSYAQNVFRVANSRVMKQAQPLSFFSELEVLRLSFLRT